MTAWSVSFVQRFVCNGFFLCAALLAVTAASASEADERSRFTIVFSGDDGVPFSGTCKAETADGPIEFALEGVVPYRGEVRARGVSCRLVKGEGRGRLTVEIRKNGQSRSRSTVTGSSGTVHISMQ